MNHDTATMGKNGQELISFSIAEQEYCVDVMAVREIRGWTPATTLPSSPEHVRGIINLRGTVLPIVDLAARLGLGTTASSARNVIIVVDIADKQVGLLVDAVSEIFTIDPKTMQPAPDMGSDAVKRLVRGVLPAEGGKLISWIALENTLTDGAAMAA
jgi:purine-binding chemotaxis protein CheW